jgi:hypothetical protein
MLFMFNQFENNAWFEGKEEHKLNMKYPSVLFNSFVTSKMKMLKAKQKHDMIDMM